MPQAFYRFEANVIGRSSTKQSSRSVVFASAYRSGEKLLFEREGVEADYSHKQGILDKGILAPEQSPSWVRDRGRLWNTVEARESRKDAQLAREILVAFPAELDGNQRREALTDFLEQNVVAKGMVADFAIHAPSGKGDQRNYHAHVLLTMRELEPSGFGNKKREWNSPSVLKEWREEWAKTLNKTFEKHGIRDRDGRVIRVDHRSYADQGIEKEPGVHLGPAVTALERQGVRTERGDINREVKERNEQLRQLHKRASQLQAEVLKLQEELNQSKGLKFAENELEKNRDRGFNP